MIAAKVKEMTARHMSSASPWDRRSVMIAEAIAETANRRKTKPMSWFHSARNGRITWGMTCHRKREINRPMVDILILTKAGADPLTLGRFPPIKE